jgi:hypothetical protein
MIPYPLQWPETMPRYSRPREAGQFRTTLAGAINNVKDSLKRFAADSGKPLASVVISSNVTLGADKPSDPGVAVWFVWDGMTVCIPVDRYAKVEANLQAIHHIIEARRTELRHGTLALVRATFTGFQALPAPAGSHWSDVLGVTRTSTVEQINAAYRSKARTAHSDAGGDDQGMSKLNVARDQALKERSAK